MSGKWTTQTILEALKTKSECEDGYFLIWNFANEIRQPDLFISALCIFIQTKSPSLDRFLAHPNTLDFLFDHYFPMIENVPLNHNNIGMSTRIHLIHMFTHLLVFYGDNLSRYDSFNSAMRRICLSIIKKSNIELRIAAFRSVTFLFRETMDKISLEQQATWMLKLIQHTLHPHPLHYPCIRFAMEVRPEKFGFITLCKTIIDNEIKDPIDLSIISKVLMLPVIKNPTEILQFLLKTAVSHHTLAYAAIACLAKPLQKFQDLDQFTPWAKLFYKRALEYIAFAEKSDRFERRRLLIVHLCENTMKWNIPYLAEVITRTSSTLLTLGLCTNIFEHKFPFTDDIDEDVKKDIEETPFTRIDYTFFLSQPTDKIPLLPEKMEDLKAVKRQETGTAGPNKKPSVAEVKARFLAAKKAGRIVESKDLSLLENLPPPPSPTS